MAMVDPKPVSNEIFATISQARDLQDRFKRLWTIGASSNAIQSFLIGNAERQLDQAINTLVKLVESQDGR